MQVHWCDVGLRPRDVSLSMIHWLVCNSVLLDTTFQCEVGQETTQRQRSVQNSGWTVHMWRRILRTRGEYIAF